jgi:hypothetical protein
MTKETAAMSIVHIHHTTSEFFPRCLKAKSK